MLRIKQLNYIGWLNSTLFKGLYIEVKGYKTDRDEAKWFYFSGDLYIIDSSLIYKLDEIDINDLMYNGPLV